MGVTSDNEYIIALSFPPTHRRMVVNLLTVVAMGMYKQQAGFSKPFSYKFSTLFLCHKQGISEDSEGVTGVILIEEW